MHLFSGKEQASKLEDVIRSYLGTISVEDLGDLVIIQIGDNSSSEKYVKLKARFCAKLGIPVRIEKINETVDALEVSNTINDISNLENTKSVIIQLPLPNSLPPKLLDLIPLDKDIDLLSKKAQERFYGGNFIMLSPVVRSLKNFIDLNSLSVSKLDVVVIGGGYLVGNPVAYYLKKSGAHVTIYDKDVNITTMKLNFDLVVLGAGVPNLVFPENIKAGSNVVDFGSSIVNNVLVGDLDLSKDTSHLNSVSPSPGGMGPLVVRYLVMNHLGI